MSTTSSRKKIDPEEARGRGEAPIEETLPARSVSPVVLLVPSERDVILNRKLGPYHLVRRLAVGGMAEIFLALKLGPGRFEKFVVVKCIRAERVADSDFSALFEQEAFLAGLLNHPSIVQTYDSGLDAGVHYVVMEYMPGVTVAELAERGAERGELLALEYAVKICLDVCEGLHYLYQSHDWVGEPLRVVHRDISPQNLFVTYDGRCKIFDFGIAHRNRGEVDADQEGVVAGKRAYMSPEQCNGQEVDGRSDVFSLGIVLFELTTGTRLFRRESEAEVIEAITSAPIPSPTTKVERYPRFLERVVLKALEQDPNERYQSAEALAEELRKFLKVSGAKPSAEGLAGTLAELFTDELAREREACREALEVANERVKEEVAKVEEEEQRAQAATIAAAEEQERALQTLSRALDSMTKRSHILGILFLVSLVIGAALGLTSSQKQAPVLVEERAPGGVVNVVSTPSGAKVFMNGEPLEETTPTSVKLPLDDEVVFRVEAPGHIAFEKELSLKEDGEVVWVQAHLHEEGSFGTEVAQAPAFIDLTSEPRTTVYHGERLLGETPFEGLELKPGGYDLRFVSAQKGIDYIEHVQLASGEETELHVKIPKGTLIIRGEPGTQVFVDGVSTGEAPQELELFVGEHTIRLERDGRVIETKAQVLAYESSEVTEEIN